MNEDNCVGNNDEHGCKLKVTNLYTILLLRQLLTPNGNLGLKLEFNCFFSANLC